jgi:hypothetical protein
MNNPDNSENFYRGLPIGKGTIGDFLADETNFRTVPKSWHVIVTDIRNSTAAILEGRHETVNFLATGSIVTVLNIAYKMGIEVPFFFGGDGATFIVPACAISAIMRGLVLYKANTLNNFGLEIRTGTMPVAQIYESGFQLHIAKFNISEFFFIPVLLGNGLNYTEKIVKGEDYLLDGYNLIEEELDLSGMQCRWDRIPPPSNQEEVVTLLILARNGTRQSYVFKTIMDAIDQLYGSLKERQPISVKKLRLKTSFKRLKTEMLVRIAKFRFLELLQSALTTMYSYLYLTTGEGKKYLERLVAMSDTLVIDGRINTVISGSIRQRELLEEILNKLESQNMIFYGIHVSAASIMSCYVRNMDDGHIHFVDGSEGGYTQAARMLKRKLIESETLKK